MSLAFDAVVPRLLEVGMNDAVLLAAKRIAVVRDPAGRVRIVLDAPDAGVPARDALERALETALGAWYAGPALHADVQGPERRVARWVLDRAKDQWPAGWPTAVLRDAVRQTPMQVDRTRWGAIQRVLSKETWLSNQTIAAPWPLHERTPTIVSFFSYKGGVGRSTLVAVVAAILAQQGDNVVVIDLDLEAPGQQALFDATPSRGVIDYLVEHVALGASDLDGLLVDVSGQIAGAEGKVHLAAAGAIGWPFVEKIARLDFVGHTGEGTSPVHDALQGLLRAVSKQYKPGWILLDARTGIHDLGGLAMHALAHVDVLLARDGRQGREGLDLCLQALRRRRNEEDILTLVVHALAPAPLSDETFSKPVQERFRHEVYELFRSTVYAELSDEALPAEEDAGEAHTPYPVPLDPTLGRLELLRDIAPSPSLPPHYQEIVTRLRDLGAPTEGS